MPPDQPFEGRLGRSISRLPDRRWFLKIGGLGAAGIGLAELLRRQSRAASSRPPVLSVILLQHYGAPSHIDLWDPKPNAPVEIRGEFKTIATSLPGYRVTEIMPRIAGICHKLALVRSMTHRIANHNPATYLAITGHTPERDVVQVPATGSDWPAFGSALARFRPPAGSDVPPFVQIPHIAYDQVYKCPGQWGGLLGKRYDPLIVVGDPSASSYRVDELSVPADMSMGRLENRHTLLEVLDEQIRQKESAITGRGLDAFYERAFAILTSPQTKRAFDLSAEPSRVRDRYGRNKVGQCYLLARRLVEAGVRFVTCFNGSDPAHGWDTHADNFRQLKNTLMPPDDLAFSALIEDLDGRGLLDSTLVIWAGEFGRKPEVAKAGMTFVGTAGRDHWPMCYTVVLAGGGMKPGFLYGSSDRFAAYPQEKPVTPADFAATLYAALGISPQAEFRDAIGRPLPLTTGTPMTELPCNL
jgi:hypothetical protein